MAQRTDRSYVLRTRELGEADLIVTLLCEQSGRVRGVARSARKSRRRFGGTLEPLTEVQARWTERAGRDLHRIESLELVRSYGSLQSDPGLQAVCATLAEITENVAREDQADPKGFRLMGAILEALEQGLDPWAALRYFEYWTLRLHGLLPDLDGCEICHRPLGERGHGVVSPERGLVCTVCCRERGISGKALSASDLEFLGRMASNAPRGLEADRRVTRAGGSVELLLKGRLESFVERKFRAYRHLVLLEPPAANGGARS